MPGNSFIWSAKPPIAQISVFLITKVYKYIHRTEMLPRHSSLKTANMTDTFPIPDWQLIWVKFIYVTDLFQVNFQGIYCCITTILTHHLPRILYWSVTNLHSHMLEGKNPTMHQRQRPVGHYIYKAILKRLHKKSNYRHLADKHYGPQTRE